MKAFLLATAAVAAILIYPATKLQILKVMTWPVWHNARSGPACVDKDYCLSEFEK